MQSRTEAEVCEQHSHISPSASCKGTGIMLSVAAADSKCFKYTLVKKNIYMEYMKATMTTKV